MKYDPAIHHRRSMRLPEYDYASPGAYFVTICTQKRVCILEDSIVAGIIIDVWHALVNWFPTMALDDFVIMPNHLHFVVWLQSIVGAAPAAAQPIVGATAEVAHPTVATPAVVRRAGASPAPTDWVIPQPEKVNLHPTVGDVVGTFKSLVFTVYLDWIEAHRLKRRAKFWQKNYYEHVIRHEIELQAIRQYIRDNPRCWAEDRDNPENDMQLPPPSKIDDYLEDIEQLITAASTFQDEKQ